MRKTNSIEDLRTKTNKKKWKTKQLMFYQRTDQFDESEKRSHNISMNINADVKKQEPQQKSSTKTE